MSNRRLDFETGDRLLFVGAPSSIPNYDERSAIRDESRLRRVLLTHLDTEQEAQQVLNLAESYNLASMPARSIRDAREAIIDLARRGRLVVVEVENLTSETPLDPTHGQNVADMDMTAKASRVFDLLPKYLGPEAAEELRALVDPATIAIALGLIVLAFTSGIGAAILIAVGWAFLGWSVFEAVDSMWKFVNRFTTATSDQDLDACAQLLADAIAKISVGLFVKLLTRGAGRVARSKGKLTSNSGSGGSSTGSSQRRQQRRQQRRPEEKQSSPPPRVKPDRKPFHRQDLDEKWYDPKTGELRWPDNNGFDGPSKRVELPPGTRIDRYSGAPGKVDGGSFLSPAGTPYGQRALPYDASKQIHSTYEVVKPLPVDTGKVAPFFGAPGGGTQHKALMSVKDLIADGYIKPVN